MIIEVVNDVGSKIPGLRLESIVGFVLTRNHEMLERMEVRGNWEHNRWIGYDYSIQGWVQITSYQGKVE